METGYNFILDFSRCNIFKRPAQYSFGRHTGFITEFRMVGVLYPFGVEVGVTCVIADSMGSPFQYRNPEYGYIESAGIIELLSDGCLFWRVATPFIAFGENEIDWLLEDAQMECWVPALAVEYVRKSL